MTVALCMIVKDEAHVIRRCLESHKDVIDYWVIVDTGSTDDTQDVIRATMAELGIPGELHERPWVDFGHNKTEMLQLAKGKADYLLQNDADHIWHGRLPKKLDGECYGIEYHYAGTRYAVTCLLSDKLDWRYVGVLHEYVESVPVIPNMRARGLSDCHIEVRHEGARSKDSQTYQKDAAILEAALKQEPNNQRYAFYLAQSYRDAGRLNDAIGMFERRTTMAGWDQETWCAHYQIGLLAERMGAAPERVSYAYLKAYQYRPTRAEPLYRLAKYHRDRSEYSLAFLYACQAAFVKYPLDALFVEESVYAWQALDELAISAYYVDQHKIGEEAARECLNRPHPLWEKQRLEQNLAFYTPKSIDTKAA